MVKRWKQRADGHYGAQTRIAGANAPEPHVSSNRRRKFRDKCANIALGGSTGASVGGAVGAAIGALGGPVTSLTGARIGGALGSLAGMFWD